MISIEFKSIYNSFCKKFQIYLLDKVWSRDFGPSEQMIYFFFSFLISPRGGFFITALSDPFPFKNVEQRFGSEFCPLWPSSWPRILALPPSSTSVNYYYINMKYIKNISLTYRG